MFNDRDDGEQFFPTPAFLTKGLRQPRRDHVWEPAPEPISVGERKDAEVKWFNAAKGFGFVSIDGENDAFLPAAVLSDFGVVTIEAGTALVVKVVEKPRGTQVSEIIEIKPASAEVMRAIERGEYTEMEPLGDSMRPAQKKITGVVKFYSSSKGFGFVTLDGDQKDIFVHVTSLNRCGLADIQAGDRVSVTTKDGRKGPEVDTISIV